MVKRAMLAVLVTCAMAACTDTSVLSKSVYDHQQRADALESRGQSEAAAAQRAAADRDRVKLARSGYSAVRTPLW